MLSEVPVLQDSLEPSVPCSPRLLQERITQGPFAFSSLGHRVLTAPPATTKPLPAVSITATMEAYVCPPLSQAPHPSVPASVALGVLTV